MILNHRMMEIGRARMVLKAVQTCLMIGMYPTKDQRRWLKRSMGKITLSTEEMALFQLSSTSTNGEFQTDLEKLIMKEKSNEHQPNDPY